MQPNEIRYFLDTMFINQDEFRAVNGVNNSLDARYMLVADVLSEHVELLADIVKESLHINKKFIPATSSRKRRKTRKTSI